MQFSTKFVILLIKKLILQIIQSMTKKKKGIKRFFIVLSILILLLFLTFIITINYLFNKYRLDIDELTSINNGIKVSSSINDNSLFNTNRSIVQIEELPDFVLDAFVNAEDKRFYSHNGYDLKRIIKAGLVNIVSKSKSQGASTISQQLIKNALLSNEKTYGRKIKEIVLSIQMEKEFSKDEILEMYLNTIYFGSNAYGIENASNLYFNKSAKDLNLNEACCLAGIIKSPSHYSPKSNYQNSIKRRNIIAKLMLESGDISQKEYEEVVNSPIAISSNSNNDFSYEEEAIYEACQLLNINERDLINKEYEIITFKDKELQNAVSKASQATIKQAETLTNSNLDSLSIVADNEGHVLAYYSNSNYDLHNLKRQPASTLKPLAVYLPAISNNIISSATPILDEKINYSGFEPNNADGLFHGYVSAKDALAHSYNIPAVKTLDCLGIKKSKDMLTNLGINISKSDANLSLALGAVKNGVEIMDLISAYTTLANNGYMKSLSFVDKILDKHGNIIYSHENFSQKVVDAESCYILTEMLKETTKTGTAKRLNSLNIPIASKTGTASNKGKNTDLFNISYTTEHIMLSWIANIKNNELPSTLHSSTQPTQIIKDICSYLYSSHKPNDFVKPEGVSYLPYDLVELKENHKLMTPSNEQSDRYIAYDYFKSDNFPSPYESNNNLELNINLTPQGANLYFNANKDKVYNIYKIQNNIKLLVKSVKNTSGFVEHLDYNIFKFEDISYYLEDDSGNKSNIIKIKPKDYIINKLNNDILVNRKKWYV